MAPGLVEGLHPTTWGPRRTWWAGDGGEPCSCDAPSPAPRSLPGGCPTTQTAPDPRPCSSRGSGSSPAEVQQGPRGGRSALCRPAEEVELCERASLLGLHVLQVEAPHQEVLAPDVLRYQVYLRRNSSGPLHIYVHVPRPLQILEPSKPVQILNPSGRL